MNNFGAENSPICQFLRNFVRILRERALQGLQQTGNALIYRENTIKKQ